MIQAKVALLYSFGIQPIFNHNSQYSICSLMIFVNILIRMNYVSVTLQYVHYHIADIIDEVLILRILQNLCDSSNFKIIINKYTQYCIAKNFQGLQFQRISRLLLILGNIMLKCFVKIKIMLVYSMLSQVYLWLVSIAFPCTQLQNTEWLGDSNQNLQW